MTILWLGTFALAVHTVLKGKIIFGLFSQLCLNKSRNIHSALCDFLLIPANSF